MPKISREVILPRSVANAELKFQRRATGRAPDLGKLDIFVGDAEIRRLGKVTATDGSVVDLSRFDGAEQPGVRLPQFREGGRYLENPIWKDENMYEGAESNDPFDWRSYEKSTYAGRTSQLWDQHSYQFPLLEADP